MAATRNAIRSQGSRSHGGPPRQIRFTLIYDQFTDAIVLDEDQNVELLAKIIETRFKIPVRKQLIYGWPSKEPSNNSVQFKELKLADTEVLLHVAAIDGPPDNEDLVKTGADADGAIPGTSRDLLSTSSQAMVNRQIPTSQTWRLHVRDLKNDETYDEINFEGDQTILDVKKTFEEITGIPVSYQVWSGWPDCVKEEFKGMMLQDIGLDKPFHSLVLMESSINVLSIEPKREIAGPSKDTPASSNGTAGPCSNETPGSSGSSGTGSVSNLKKTAVVPSGSRSDEPTSNDSVGTPAPKPIRRMARKSTTKGALLAFRNGNQSNRAGLTSDRNAGSSSQAEEDSLPGPSTPKKMKIAPVISPGKSPKKSYNKIPDLPNKAIKRILKELDPLTQLSLRRACKTTRTWIGIDREEDLLTEEEKWKNFSFTVTGEGYKTFDTVVTMNVPVTRFIFNVDNEWWYLRDDIDTFRSAYFDRVRDVTLTNFFMFQNPKEREVFDSFTNLEKLTINDLMIPEGAPRLLFPTSLAQLKILKLNYEISIPLANVLIRPKSWDMTWSMLSDCQSLLYFRFPRTNEVSLTSHNALPTSEGIFAPLMEYISMRVRGCGMSLEYLDMKHFDNTESSYVCRYVDLLRRCHLKDIKIKNVHSLVVEQAFDDDVSVSDVKLRFCENVISFINYCSFLENAPLRNLEKIIVDVIPSVENYTTLGKDYKDMFWPNLRVIKIKDTGGLNKVDVPWKKWQELQEDLYGYNGLFDRGSVQYVKIDSPNHPYFLSEGRLAQKFYNLKRLEIVSWTKTDKVLNKRLNVIWKKLKLEEVRIENCPQLNDNSFMGDGEDDEDENFPFLNLSGTLRSLTLGLDNTDVTDLSLRKVFSRMPIKRFILLSENPTKISEAGLLKLQDSERAFAKTIEYFPLHCWKPSERLDRARFQRLAKNFRSLR